ncbi:hypothetical protein Tco_0735498 [Tanacetum coccineum]
MSENLKRRKEDSAIEKLFKALNVKDGGTKKKKNVNGNRCSGLAFVLLNARSLLLLSLEQLHPLLEAITLW